MVAQKLVDELLCHFSIPEQLHSDQGIRSQVESKLIAKLNIHKSCNCSYDFQCMYIHTYVALLNKFTHYWYSQCQTSLFENL